jgi:WD40 repeat protein
MGIAGRYGFVGATGSDIGLINRFFAFGHSGFFSTTKVYPSDNLFMERMWVPLLTSDAPPKGSSLIPPKAGWFAGLEYSADTLKVIVLAILCLISYYGFQRIDTWLAVTQAKLVRVNSPVDALLLIEESSGARSSMEGQNLKQELLKTIEGQARRQSAYIKTWPSRGLFSAGYFSCHKLGDVSPDLRFNVFADGNNVRLADREFPESPSMFKAISPACGKSDIYCDAGTRPSTVRFSRSGKRVLVARHAFIFVYDTNGELLACTCTWHTKDQWKFLELFKNDTLLLASANEGQIMFFRVDSVKDPSIEPLVDEFSHGERKGGAIVTLDEYSPTDLVLTTHHLGFAYLWKLETDPKPRLSKMHEFSLPKSRQKPADSSYFPLRLAKSDEEFITSAGMGHYDKQLFIVTTYKDGPADLWKLQDGLVVPMGTLTHEHAKVTYAKFSKTGSRIITMGEDGSWKIWHTSTGETLIEGKGSPPDSTAAQLDCSLRSQR